MAKLIDPEDHPGCRYGKIFLYREYYTLEPHLKRCPECGSNKALGQDGNGNAVCVCRHIYAFEKN